MNSTHTEQEIDTIIHTGVFSDNKTGFVRLGHNLTISGSDVIETDTCTVGDNLKGT